MSDDNFLKTTLSCHAYANREDLLADRMGQYASGSAPEMLEQARTLFALSKISTSIIWIGVSTKKREMILAFRTYKSSRPAVSLDAFGRDVARRRAELGITDADMPRNSGTRRTESKKALLKAIKDIGGNW